MIPTPAASMNPPIITSTNQLDWNSGNSTNNNIALTSSSSNYYSHLQHPPPLPISIPPLPPPLPHHHHHVSLPLVFCPTPTPMPTTKTTISPPLLPPTKNFQDIHEAEAIKFIQDNDLAIKKARCRSSSSNFHSNRKSISGSERVRSRSRSPNHNNIRNRRNRSPIPSSRRSRTRSRSRSRTRRPLPPLPLPKTGSSRCNSRSRSPSRIKNDQHHNRSRSNTISNRTNNTNHHQHHQQQHRSHSNVVQKPIRDNYNRNYNNNNNSTNSNHSNTNTTSSTAAVDRSHRDEDIRNNKRRRRDSQERTNSSNNRNHTNNNMNTNNNISRRESEHIKNNRSSENHRRNIRNNSKSPIRNRNQRNSSHSGNSNNNIKSRKLRSPSPLSSSSSKQNSNHSNHHNNHSNSTNNTTTTNSHCNSSSSSHHHYQNRKNQNNSSSSSSSTCTTNNSITCTDNGLSRKNKIDHVISIDDKKKEESNNEDEESEDDTAVEPWVRSAPAELYYTRGENGEMMATNRTINICTKFEKNLVQKAIVKRLEAEKVGAEYMTKLVAEEAETCHSETSGSESSSCDSSDSSGSDEEASSSSKSRRSDTSNRELQRRTKHPRRLHSELWHNDPGQMNDGPVCRCSAKARRFGIRHGFYPGESTLYSCAPYSNNSTKLYHYTIIISPRTNLLIKSPTVIPHDGHDYIFEGFSIFSHYKLDLNLPPCRVIRFNIRYCMCIAEEVFPQTFCVKELKLFEKYIFNEILELVDIKIDYSEDSSCSQFHLMPRFVRKLPDNGKEILSMNRVLEHLLKSDKELIKESDLPKLLTVDQSSWQNFADKHKGTIVTKLGMKPCAIRVDQIDRDVSGHEEEDEGIPFPLIVHFGIRPPQLSYAGNVEYQRAWRRFVKYRHLLSNMPKPKIEDKRKLLEKDLKLQEMRTRSTMKRDVTVAVSAKGFRTTGICCDLVQHAMLIPVLFAHLRFHKGLQELENRMQYRFNNRYLLQLAMTHPSYRENFGTNPDHARNALTNCGIRQPEYGDRKIHYASSRKRGINTLIDIMARFGMKIETESDITHNERLEFLGDAVVEFVTSIHLFHIFPELEEGGLATYRAAIVQNQHLAVLAQNLGLDQFMLYAHGSDLCHDSELRHAMANCFEALMGALFLDGGVQVWSQIKVADRVFSSTMYGPDPDVLQVWIKYPRHPLQVQEPKGDRHWIESHKALQKLTEFEEATGIIFNHIRLLARAFTDRSLGYNNLSQGSNQRLEFLGDTVLQLIASEYLYRFFPDHHEGHLSLLRSSLVNNRTQAVVCDTLGMAQYAMRNDPKSDMKTKDRADLLEAFLGALYIDQGLQSCVVFCSVCFFPRLEDSIVNQDWNDPKSKLQQCCLTLRSMDGKEPEIPSYKVTEVIGPTNTRVYKVAVYFKNKRLATSRGHSIQEAEMNAASYALVKRDYLFPQLKHQKRLLEKTTKKINQQQQQKQQQQLKQEQQSTTFRSKTSRNS